MPETSYLQAGDINVVNILLISKKGFVDIKQLFTQINIYEDIFKPFITGKVTLLDSNNIIDEGKFNGEERILLEVETPGIEINRVIDGIIYKLEDREQAAMKSAMYTLHFMSVEGFVDINTKISRTYKGSIQEVAEKIIKNELRTEKEITVEKTSNNIIFTSNFWSPLQCLSYLTKRAINTAVVPHSDFVFFENYNGFIFGSIETLFTVPILQAFVRDQQDRGANPIEDLNKTYSIVLDMSVPVMYDYIDRHMNGFYGGSNYFLDIDKKEIDFFSKEAKIEYIYETQLNTKNDLETEEEVFNPLSIIDHTIDNSLRYDLNPLEQRDNKIQRLSFLNQLFLNKVDIKVFGRLDYTAGRIVHLTITKDIPIDERTLDEDIIDHSLSGNYLISSLNHEITKSNHYCLMELVKNSHIE